MKTKKGLLGLMLVASAAVFFTQSCSKDDGGSISDIDLALAQDEAYVDALYEEIDNMVVSEIATLDDNDYSNTALKSTAEDICYTITVDHPDSTSFPKEVTIDFGDGCSIVFNGDTITRSGQVIVTITNRWFMPEAQHIITFNNFYFNGVKIEGTRTITNLGLNERNHLELGIVLQDGKATYGEVWMTREANHVREWARHRNPLNDTIFITGSANGINVMGETYSREITEQLVLVRCEQYQYRWVIAGGKVEITNSARGNTTIDYTGSGCSGNVVVNKDGNQYSYRFKYHNRNNRGGN